MAYRIEFAPRAERDFGALDGSIQRRIARRIESLSRNPYPVGIKKLQGDDEIYRLRIGDNRILYQVKGGAAGIDLGNRAPAAIYRRIVR